MIDNSNKQSKTLLFFYILVAYVLLQFAWWFYMLFNLNNDVYNYKVQLSNYTTQYTDDHQKKLYNKWIMIIGEGLVFLILLCIGIIKVRKSYKREYDVSLNQKNFLLSITHELKSPIASIKLQLQTMSKRKLEPSTQTELIVNALKDTERLNELVEKILISAKIENKAWLLQPEYVNVSETVNVLVNYFSEKNPSFIQSNIKKEVYASIDKLLLQTIVHNIVENAIKYSPNNTSVEITLSENEKTFVLVVKDSGIGIPVQEKEKIFTKFYRIENEETRKFKGTGLGLYIVKNLIELHEGYIRVSDNKPNGSIFEITLKK